jgi:hypothetical protein
MTRHEDYMKKKANDLLDMVNHPPHYTTGSVECLDAIKSALGDGYVHYCQGVILKYVWRFERKEKPLEDLGKAEFYLKELQKFIEDKLEEDE